MEITDQEMGAEIQGERIEKVMYREEKGYTILTLQLSNNKTLQIMPMDVDEDRILLSLSLRKQVEMGVKL